MTERRTVALLMAAGQGLRTGGEIPKQFQRLVGRPVIAHAFASLSSHPAVDEVAVVCAEGREDTVRDALAPLTPPIVVVGGAERQASVAAGLAVCGGAKTVLIHDAARPLLPAAVIDKVLGALADAEGAIPVLPIADTLARGTDLLGEVVPRDGLLRVQTPQGFRLSAIREAHEAWTGDAATDDAQMVRRLGGRVALVQGDPMLEKITRPEDFAAAEARLAASSEVRVATGFDVHRLEAGEELWLGGVLIPHDKGLSGHSDADVALHAITDALLGTIADGDIGTHFPPSDPQWRGADSARFLRHAADLIGARGGTISFLDLTLICEAPKIGPHREPIRARIAELLGLQPRQISVKATTTERLGFTGRGEGIAAQACATVRLPWI